MKTIKSDPSNKSNIKITKQDSPLFFLSLDLKGADRAQLNIVTEYVSSKMYEAMLTQPNYDQHGHIRDYGTIYNPLGDGHYQLGYESGISPATLDKALNPNIPHVHIPSFLARIGCEYDAGSLISCIHNLLDFAHSITTHGVQDDKIMGGKNYAMNLKAMDTIDLVTSAGVPTAEAKNAIPTLGHSYKIADIYSKTHKPLTNLIRRAYLVPPRYFKMHVFNNGVAKLQRMSESDVLKDKDKLARTYITWSEMQKIRKHQKPIAKIVKRKLHKKK